MSKKGQMCRFSAGRLGENSNINSCELWRANDCAPYKGLAGSSVLTAHVCLDLHFYVEYLKIFNRINAKCVQGVVQM